MSQLKSWVSTAEGANLLPQNRRTRTSSALMAANIRAQSELGATTDCGQDARGQALRMLRMHHHVDPAMLATQACISLRQLFELETGGSSLFYNDALRNQAGRRVASILGADWDQLCDMPPPAGKHIRLVPLPGPAASAPLAAPQLPAVQRDVPAPYDMHAILMKPAADTLVMDAEPTAQLTSPPVHAPAPGSRRSGPSRALAGWLFFALFGYGVWAAASTFLDIRL